MTLAVLWLDHPEGDGIASACAGKRAHVYRGEPDSPGQELWQWDVYNREGQLIGRGAALCQLAARRCAESFMLFP